jgi:formylglycine-generating enzyme required for sulfatase activity
MNITSQYIVNPKSRHAYYLSLASYKSIRTTKNKLRLDEYKQVLNSKNIIFDVEGTEFKMIRCPIGKFIMGMEIERQNIIPSDGPYYEPKRMVTIKKPFLLGETEVTQGLFEKVMGFNPSYFKMSYDSNENPVARLPKAPVEQVTWYDAVMFCNKLSKILGKRPHYNISNVVYKKNEHSEKKEELPNISEANVTINPHANGFRLPYEKEWEYAARAGTNNRWAGTDQEETVDHFAWVEVDDIYGYGTAPSNVKQKAPNEWGFYDMTGNVKEWCWDERIRKGYSTDNFEDQNESTEILVSKRITKGDDSWDGLSSYSVGDHDFEDPNYIYHFLGFRVAMSSFN